jgi:hypothetical protein
MTTAEKLSDITAAAVERHAAGEAPSIQQKLNPRHQMATFLQIVARLTREKRP